MVTAAASHDPVLESSVGTGCPGGRLGVLWTKLRLGLRAMGTSVVYY